MIHDLFLYSFHVACKLIVLVSKLQTFIPGCFIFIGCWIQSYPDTTDMFFFLIGYCVAQPFPKCGPRPTGGPRRYCRWAARGHLQ